MPNLSSSHRPQVLQSREEILAWLERNGVNTQLCRVEEDLTVNVHSSIYLLRQKLEYLPVNFGYVLGTFDVRENHLFTIEGSPHEVGESFHCGMNRLTSLKGAPKKVGESFNCAFNKLDDLTGGPVEVGKTYSCNNTRLKSLKGVPEKLNYLDCHQNELTSLEFVSKHIESVLVAGNNPLTTLRFAPDYVGQELWIEGCEDLSEKEILTLKTEFKHNARLFFSHRYKHLFPTYIKDSVAATHLSAEVKAEDYQIMRQRYILKNQLSPLSTLSVQTNTKPLKI